MVFVQQPISLTLPDPHRRVVLLLRAPMIRSGREQIFVPEKT
jgi:hypothetical protein